MDDITHARRHTGLGGHQRNLPEVVERLQVAGRAHHVLRLAQFQYRAAGFLGRVVNYPSSSNSNTRGSEMNGGEEVASGLVIASGNGTELLEFAKEVLDQMTRLV